MLKDKLIKKIIFVSIIFYSLGILIFSIVSFLNTHLLIGWSVGGAVSIGTFILSTYLKSLLLKKTKSKSSGFWLGWLISIMQLVVHAGIFISVIAINGHYNNKTFGSINTSDIQNPINIFTYIVSIGIAMASSIVGTLIYQRKQNGK